MSVYAPAMSTLRGLDIMFDSLQREFVLGKKRIIAPARAMRKVPPINGGTVPQTYFDADDEVYEALATDDIDSLKIYDNSVELRVEQHISGINGELSILCSQVGFDPGTLAFDSKGYAHVSKTATEVISENSKTYGTIQAHENILEDSLTEMVEAIIELAVKYGLTWNGQTIESMISGGYSVAVKFDDSIIQDRTANIDEGLKLISAAAMSKKKFMVDTLGYTPEEADAEIQQIAAEKKINSSTIDTILFSSSE